jgi:hypothetical protein
MTSEPLCPVVSLHRKHDSFTSSPLSLILSLRALNMLPAFAGLPSATGRAGRPFIGPVILNSIFLLFETPNVCPSHLKWFESNKPTTNQPVQKACLFGPTADLTAMGYFRILFLFRPPINSLHLLYFSFRLMEHLNLLREKGKKEKRKKEKKKELINENKKRTKKVKGKVLLM